MDTCTDKLQTCQSHFLLLYLHFRVPINLLILVTSLNTADISDHIKAMNLIPKSESETTYTILRLIVWLVYTELAVIIAAVFTHYVAPQAIGRYFLFIHLVFPTLAT